MRDEAWLCFLRQISLNRRVLLGRIRRGLPPSCWLGFRFHIAALILREDSVHALLLPLRLRAGGIHWLRVQVLRIQLLLHMWLICNLRVLHPLLDYGLGSWTVSLFRLP